MNYKTIITLIAPMMAAAVTQASGQTDPSDKHSYIGSRARAKALQTDQFPRPPGNTVSATTQPRKKH